MDPLSIAGLTIAVLDQLWKMGDRTAELVSNFRVSEIMVWWHVSR
jgi:hypothetical protein